MPYRRRIAKTIGVLCLISPLVSAIGAQTNGRDSLAVAAAGVRIESSTPADSPAGADAAGTTHSQRPADGSRSVDAALAATSDSPRSGPRTLMIVGGAAVVVGVVVGGTAGSVLLAGGAIVGLIGLWHYLQ